MKITLKKIRNIAFLFNEEINSENELEAISSTQILVQSVFVFFNNTSVHKYIDRAIQEIQN